MQFVTGTKSAHFSVKLPALRPAAGAAARIRDADSILRASFGRCKLPLPKGTCGRRGAFSVPPEPALVLNDQMQVCQLGLPEHAEGT